MNEQIFNGVGEIYAKFRPTYPATLFNYLYSEIGIKPNSTIADIGSGTGIFTQELLKNNITVYAVEPNSDMRKIAEKNLKNIPGFFLSMVLLKIQRLMETVLIILLLRSHSTGSIG